MTLEEFIFLSTFYQQIPPFVQRLIDKVWEIEHEEMGALAMNEIVICWGLSQADKTHLNRFISCFKNRQSIYTTKENAYMNNEKNYTINHQYLRDIIKNNHGITDLDIEQVVFEGYHEGSAGPGVVLFSFPKEKREKKRPREKIEKLSQKEQKRSAPHLFEKFWKRYPRKTARRKANLYFQTLINSDLIDKHPNGLNGFFEDLMNGLERQIEEKNLALRWECFTPQWPHPSSWLNQQRWTDETNLNMEYWENECKRNHRQSDYLRIRDRNESESVKHIADDDFE